MQLVIIIGCGGAGKSTLARQLGEKTGLPVVHLDKLFWKPGWVSLTEAEFDAVHCAALAQEKWIIDGNFNRTMELRLEKCDTVIYLDFNRVTCLLGVAKRILTTYGKVRPDMGDGCPERFDWEFLQWVWNFNKNGREKNYCLLAQYTDKEIHILKNRSQVRRFLESV